MEPIIINIATTVTYDKRLYRFLVLGLTLLVVGLSIFNLYSFLGNLSTHREYQKKVETLEKGITEEKRVNEKVKGHMDDAEKVRIEKEVSFINTLISKRAFPWLSVLDQIEMSMPEGLLLMKIGNGGPDSNLLTLEGYAKQAGSVAQFMDGLKKRGAYFKASLSSLSVDSSKDDTEVKEALLKFQVALTLTANQGEKREEKTGR